MHLWYTVYDLSTHYVHPLEVHHSYCFWRQPVSQDCLKSSLRNHSGVVSHSAGAWMAVPICQAGLSWRILVFERVTQAQNLRWLQPGAPHILRNKNLAQAWSRPFLARFFFKRLSNDPACHLPCIRPFTTHNFCFAQGFSFHFNKLILLWPWVATPARRNPKSLPQLSIISQSPLTRSMVRLATPCWTAQTWARRWVGPLNWRMANVLWDSNTTLLDSVFLQVLWDGESCKSNLHLHWLCIGPSCNLTLYLPLAAVARASMKGSALSMFLFLSRYIAFHTQIYEQKPFDFFGDCRSRHKERCWVGARFIAGTAAQLWWQDTPVAKVVSEAQVMQYTPTEAGHLQLFGWPTSRRTRDCRVHQAIQEEEEEEEDKSAR